MRTSELITDLVTALAKARTEFKPILKDQQGQVAGNRQYRYSSLLQVFEATLPALAKHGLVLIQAPDAETSTLVTRLCHSSGQWVESSHPLRAYADQPQAYGSALTYAKRYAACAVLAVVAEDDDDAATAENSPRPNHAHPPANTTAPAARQAPPKPTSPPAEGRTGEAHIIEVTRDSGEKNGKPWTRWRVTFDDHSPMATTFSQSLGDSAQQAYEAGAYVRYTTQLDAKGVRLVALEAPVDDDGPSPF